MQQKSDSRNRVAIIEDEKDLADLFGDAIKSQGYDVEVFTDAAHASTIISSQHDRYALVLSDIRMPGMSGIELAEYLSKVDSAIAIVLMTAYDSVEQNRFRCVQKPIAIYKLVEIVREYVGDGVDTLVEIQKSEYHS